MLKAIVNYLFDKFEPEKPAKVGCNFIVDGYEYHCPYDVLMTCKGSDVYFNGVLQPKPPKKVK